ncbi:unnamed protein product [Symbiodinium sp. CCMP2592]|nr:unnamed protein product [Symbiodinium sp. CCMP2592]
MEIDAVGCESRAAKIDQAQLGLPVAVMPPDLDAIRGNLFLEICSGPNRPLSAAVLAKGVPVLSIDILLHEDHNLLNDSTYDSLMRLCYSGQVNLAHASPPCTEYSRLKLRADGGPRAIRTPEHMSGVPDLSPSERQRLEQSKKVLVRTINLLLATYCAGGHVSLENPLNSMAWLEQEVREFLQHINADLNCVAACGYGMDVLKQWCFACSFRDLQQIACSCQHDPQSHAQVAGIVDKDGVYASRATSEFPVQLAQAYAEAVLPLFETSSKPYTISLEQVRFLRTHKTKEELPRSTQDGGGIYSMPDWSFPPSGCKDLLGGVRKQLVEYLFHIRDRLWNLLEDSGCTCVRELRLHFHTPWHLACSVDSLEDSVVLAEQVLPSAVSSDHKRAGALIWGWLRDQTDLLKRVQGRLKTKATRIVAPPCGDVSPGEVYAQLVSGSLELTKQTSRAHARWISGGAGTPADAEKAARKFWGTVLVQIMVEAKLPIVDIPVESEEQRVLYALRALGTRRSKTLRNRARAWRKARNWMLSVKSVAFPRRPSDVVDYLLFLEQEFSNFVSFESCEYLVVSAFLLKGFWSDFFKPVMTTDDLLSFPRFDRLSPPVEFLQEALEADELPGPKRARKAVTVTFERVVLNRAVISWRDQREADLSRALIKWCRVFASWDSESSPVTRQLQEAASPEACHDLLGDYLARKAPSTCLKRANSMLMLGKSVASEGLTMPMQEPSLYSILRDCKTGGASLSALRGIMEAITFVHFTFDISTLHASVKSKRCWGLSSAKQATLASKADPFTVEEILEMHRILYEGDDLWDRLMCGVSLYCIYARCRWSDFQHVDSLSLECNDQGFAEFGSAFIDVHKTMNFSSKLPKCLELVAVGRGLDGKDWLCVFMEVRKALGVEYNKGYPSMPAPDKSGAPTVRALGSDEAGAWLRELLPGREGRRTTSHSLKATLLSFAAKRGLAHTDRLALGGHFHGAHMADVYARDALARPLRLLAGMLSEIRLGKFAPDAGRAARFPGRTNEELIGAELPTGAHAAPTEPPPLGDVHLGSSNRDCSARGLESFSQWDLVSLGAPSHASRAEKSEACTSHAGGEVMSVKSDGTEPPSPDFSEGVGDLSFKLDREPQGSFEIVPEDISEVNPDDGVSSDGDTSSEGSSSESSDSSEGEHPEPRLMPPPSPPEGTFFMQHRKLKTLHLLLAGHRSFTLCGRPLQTGDSPFIAAFAARCKEICGDDSLHTLLQASGVRTHSALAFSCGTPKAQPTEAEFKAFADSVVGSPASIGRVSQLKRLHFESSTLVIAQLRALVEGDSTEAGKRLPAAEKSARLADAKKRLKGLVIEDEMEPSHALIDAVSHMGESNAVVWIPPSKCTKRDAELKLGLRDKQKYLTVQEQSVTLAPAPDKIVAEHGTPLEVQWCLQRRGLAFFMCGFMEWETHEKWVASLLRCLSSDVPPGYAPISMQQILRADSEIFLLLAREVERVKPDSSGVMEMDVLMNRFRHDPRITTYLQPLQRGSASQGELKSCPYHADSSGHRFCWQFNLGKCNAECKGKGKGKKGKGKGDKSDSSSPEEHRDLRNLPGSLNGVDLLVSAGPVTFDATVEHETLDWTNGVTEAPASVPALSHTTTAASDAISGVIIDVFAGDAAFCKAAHKAGFRALAFDLKPQRAQFPIQPLDITQADELAVLLEVISEHAGATSLVQFTVPCLSTFFTSKTGSWSFAELLVDAVFQLCSHCRAVGVPFAILHPATSRFWHMPSCQHFFQAADGEWTTFDQCMHGGAQVDDVLSSPWTWATKHCKHDAHTPTKDFSDVCGLLPPTEHSPVLEVVWIGIPREPDDFLRRAVAAGHPKSLLDVEADPHMTLLIDNLLNSNVKQPDKGLHEVRRWTELRSDLSESQEVCKKEWPIHVAQVLDEKPTLLMDELLTQHDFPDRHLVKHMTQGFRLTGWVCRSGLFPFDPKPPASTLQSQLSMAKSRNTATLTKLSKQAPDEVSRRAWAETLEEVDKGWIEEDENPDLSTVLVAKRFGLLQGPKVRVIDDCRACAYNLLAGIPEKYRLQSVEYIAAFLLRAMLDPRSKGVSISGKTLDLTAAYKQYATHPFDRDLLRIGVKDTSSGHVRTFKVNSLPFGATGSVSSFLRCAAAIWFLGSHALGIPWTNYFDDFPIFSKDSDCDLVEEVATSFLDLLHVYFARAGKKATVFTKAFKALGLIIDLSHFGEGYVTIGHTQERGDELRATITRILESNRLSHAEAESLRGRLHWYTSFLFGRRSSQALNVLSDWVNRSASKGALPTELRESLTFLRDVALHSEPLKISRSLQRTFLIFTDGSLEGNFACVGGILHDSQGVPLAFFSVKLNQERNKSALSVLEDAGQVPLASQLCKDRLVVAASKSSEAEVHVGVTNKKQVAEVPFFVGRDVGLSGRDWLLSGFDLWKGLGQLDRTFLVFQSSEDFEEPIFKFAKPEVISNYMRLIWRQLKVPFRKIGEHVWKSRAEGTLLGDECYLFWTGHSMRHVLPTIAAVLEVPKERRDYLGRWHIGLHQSSDYIHTCRQIVHDIQRRVCDKLSGGKPGYDEEELFDELREWLRDRGSDPDPWLRLHAVMRTVSGCKVLNQTWPLLADFTDGNLLSGLASAGILVIVGCTLGMEKVDPSSSSGESSSTELGEPAEDNFILSVLSVFSFARLGATMAADPAAQRQFLKDNVDADFIFLLEEHGVDLALQYAIGQHYRSIRTFAAFADDRGAARTAITADFGVRAESAADRARMACVITSWELRAEAKVLGVQKPLVSSDRAAMRAALEAVRGYSVPESEEPAPEYLAHKLEQIENGEPTASYLDEVISRKESNSLQLQTSLDNQGRLRVMRQKPKGKLPQNTEERRAKIRLEASTWVMLAAKCRGRAYLQGLQLSHFDRFLEYLLGDKCYSMQVASAAPMSSSAHADRHTLSVPWNILLQYEFELRKWAIKEAHRLSAPLGDKLHEATTNTELKELHFTPQVALSRRSTGADPPPPKWPRKGDGKKGEKGGKDKGGKDGKGKADGKIKIGESWFDLVSKSRDVSEFTRAESKADVRAWLEVLCTSQNIILEMSEVDICRDPSMDLLDSAVADRCLLQVQNSEWDVVLVTPPCNTFSRARCVQPGPRPLRSRIYPAGFPWLSDSHRAAADNGNQFVSFSFQICTAALSNSIPFLLEHPEDLGMTTTGHTPASIWQVPEAAVLFTHEQVVTFAIYQCHYGAHTPKPTRFLSSIAATSGMRFMGPPRFDSADKYLGPLPKYCGHRHSNRLLGAANTAAAAAYPPNLCKAIASWTFSVFDGGGGAPSEVATVPEQDDIPFSELKSGCEGPPMVGDFAGSSDEFVDGFGRCSPGRWKPCNRGTAMSAEALDFAQRLKERVRMFVVECVPDLAKSTFRLATGHWNGPLFDQGRLEKLREDWFNMLPDPIRAREMIPHQPFYLRAISQTLRILGDPDYRIIEEGEFCFVNGDEKDQKYHESTWQPLMQNYRDGAEVEKALEEAFTKEEAEGRMFPLSLAEAKARFPGPALRIAAQAVIPKPDHEFRVVHDGTHEVHVNNEIVMLDRLESPGPREISSIQKLGMVAEEKVLFGLVGDVKKAHRRYLHHPEHWGVLVCRARSDSSVVWLNRTGTFGIASAAYWFARLIGLVGRLSLRVMLQAFVFMLIYADDLHLLSGGSDRWLNLWMSLALLCMQGTPFSEKKWRGGLQLDWVGYWIDYGRFKLGISEKRCQWIIRSIEGMEGDSWLVDVRRFHELHGRLGFMSQILIWIRPFLAPGYAWLAVVSKGAVLALPNLIRCTLRFILDRLRAGSRTYPAGLADKDYGELFRTDAACNSDSVVLGGWKVLGAPGPASTSAELLSSLVALHLLERDFPEVFSCPGSFRACFAGGTDNKSADAISARLLTTKVPVMFVLMEYAHRCDLAGVRCLLNWRPRDANQEADRITKNDFSDFCPGLRVTVSWSELNFSVLPSLLRFANFQSTLDDARYKQQWFMQQGVQSIDWSVAEHQPYSLLALQSLSRALQDRDDELFPALIAGVPTGFFSDIPSSHVFVPKHKDDSSETPAELVICDRNWKGARDNPKILSELIDKEISEGFLEELDLASAQQRWENIAVAKLNVVLADNRKPRLIMDGTVSGVNSFCFLNERCCLPSLKDVRSAFPLRMNNEDLSAFSLDIRAAHKTIRIREKDRGLAGIKLEDGRHLWYRVCPFGTGFSALWWARLSAFMIRTCHLLIWLCHALGIFVDDLLLWQGDKAIEISGCLILSFCQAYNVPLSWHKLQCGYRVKWIGWLFSFRAGTFSLPTDKIEKILRSVRVVLRPGNVDRCDLEKTVGLLQWVSQISPELRPWMAFLYSDLHRPVATNHHVDSGEWHLLHEYLDDNLRFTSQPPGTAIPQAHWSSACTFLHGALPGSPVLWFSGRFEKSDFDDLNIPLDNNTQKNIGCWELLAQIALALLFAETCPGGRCRLQLRTFCDNASAQASANRLMTTSSPLCFFAQQLAFVAFRHGITLDVHHISGFRNEEADYLSRWNGTDPLVPEFAANFRYRYPVKRMWQSDHDVRVFPEGTRLLWSPP